MRTTSYNLQAAFAGESQANRRYLAFASKADAEGYPQIARLFRAAAQAETVHALAHLRVMGQVKGTADNLRASMAGESHEFTEMYPEFVALAKTEGQQGAEISFRNAQAVEEVHHGLFSEALRSLESGSDLPSAPMFVCGTCGFTTDGQAPEKCPVCGALKAKFSQVD